MSRLLCLTGNRIATPCSQLYSQFLVSVHFPLEGEEGKGNTEEEQCTEDGACMSTVEKKMQFYFCKVSENQQDLLGWGSERHGVSFTEASETWCNFSVLVELLSRLPRKQYIPTHSPLLLEGNSIPSEHLHELELKFPVFDGWKLQAFIILAVSLCLDSLNCHRGDMNETLVLVTFRVLKRGGHFLESIVSCPAEQFNSLPESREKI